MEQQRSLSVRTIALNSILAGSQIARLFRFKLWHYLKTARWGLLLVLGLALGGSYVAFRQWVVLPRQAEQNRLPNARVQKTNLTLTVSANGTVAAERSINISPKNAGVLKRLLVKEGDGVKQGQIIAYMDDSNLQGQLLQAQGNLAQVEAALRKSIEGNRSQEIERSQAELAQTEASLQELINGNRPEDIAQAQARLNSAQAVLSQAQDDFHRNQSLYSQGAISRSDLNLKRKALDQARADVLERQQALRTQRIGTRPEQIAQQRAIVKQKQASLSLQRAGNRATDIDQARAQVTASRGALKTIQTQLEDTVLRAPFDGLITQKFADPGAFVTPTTAGSTVSGAASNSIVTLASINQVEANIAEANIAQIRLGQNVKIKADAFPGKIFAGKVLQIAAEATVQQNVTSFKVNVALLSNAQMLLRSGMNVVTDFQIGQLSDVLTVPTVSVARQDGKLGVYRVTSSSKPEFVPIEAGVTVQNRTEVKSGLQEAETVLLTFPPGERPKSSGFPPDARNQ
ncbi:biotin/lipoyl-binding protein [Altericista sp. CCNU0014]|uniref:efflux RND transporter periplasmic adaptor subunit n=1 Tax=Altericista sp. CCNU0014 TaxID=3082949 RepID=UPI00384CA354